MRFGWLIILLVVALIVGTMCQVTLREPLSSEDMSRAAAYDMKKESKKDEITSIPKTTHFTVLLEKKNDNTSQDNREFSKKNNAIVYNMGCVLEKETTQEVEEPISIHQDKVTDIKLPMETNKLNSYIALSPKDGKYFPSNFELKITNKVDVNKYNYELWGTTPGRETAPSNGVISADNIKSMPYPEELYTIKNTDVIIKNINIGNNALNIVSIGTIFDGNFNAIGNVDNVNNDIIISCDKAEKVTGILIYIGAPVLIK